LSSNDRRPSNGFKRREQDELIDLVEERELKTQQILQEMGTGEVNKTVLLIAKKLHLSERKAREYFMKEWATDNIELFKNGRVEYWRWTGPKKKLEPRFDVDKMRSVMMEEEGPPESATEYMHRKDREKADEWKNAIDKKLGR